VVWAHSSVAWRNQPVKSRLSWVPVEIWTPFLQYPLYSRACNEGSSVSFTVGDWWRSLSWCFSLWLNNIISCRHKLTTAGWCYRDGLLKMQDVFSKNPKMGDPASLAPQLDENSRTLDQLQQEIRKYEVLPPIRNDSRQNPVAGLDQSWLRLF